MTSDADPEILQNCKILSIGIYDRSNRKEPEDLNLEGSEPYNPECEWNIESAAGLNVFLSVQYMKKLIIDGKDIGRLTISGHMTPDEEAALKARFPKAIITRRK